MLNRVLDFSAALRDAGIPVGASENADALRALELVPLEQKELVRAALASTLIKSEAQRPAFDTLFELYFTTGRGPESSTDAEADPHRDVDDIRRQLAAALVSGDGATLAGLAADAVAQFGRIDGSPSKDWYSHYQVMRALDLDNILRQLWDDVPAELSDVDAIVWRDRLRERMARFRELTLTETRRRVAEYRGPSAVATYAVSPLPRDADFFGISTDLTQLRKAVRPLARKLATRVSMKRKRSARGALDVRRTVRHSLSSGGVPLDVRLRHRAPHRPELFILCDISGSVGRFARFTLMLTHALSAQFTRVRSFAFIDKVDEVTRFFDHEDFVVAVERMNEEAKVVWLDGHSDYGSCLEEFWQRFGEEVGPRTTVLILGDARNNYRARKTWALKELRKRARHVYWLNPESSGDWDSGDSVASEYAAEVDRMVEVRNLRQLEDFVANVL
jgi:uncharacterized protein